MTDRSMFSWPKPDLQNIKALRGKKIAVVGPGAIDDVLLREVFSANGIDGGKDATILAIGAAETRFAALASGTVDAAVLIAPFTFNAKEAGFKELITFKDEGFVLPSGGIVARDELLKADPVNRRKVCPHNVDGLSFDARQSFGSD